MTFGRSNHTKRQWSITIAPGGGVTTTGDVSWYLSSVPRGQDTYLSGLVRDAIGKLKSENCPGTSPDGPALFIGALGKTVTVRGKCNQGFARVWRALVRTSVVGSRQNP